MPVLRVACYWIASIAAAGTVAGLAHFSTYSASRGPFWEAFWLYTIPIPMAGLALALAYHVAAFLQGDGDHWAYFAFVTVDVFVLFVIGLLVAPVPAKPARREVHRA